MPTLHRAAIAALTITLLGSTLASAQTTYQWIDPKSGRTMISDQPPPAGIKPLVRRSSEISSETQMPYATRQATEKFPVALYTSPSCVELCKQARDLLNSRGTPFTEKMLKTQEEFDLLAKQLGEEVAVPSLSVGRQNFKGFEAGAWNNQLDLAGYPKSAPYGVKPSGAFAR